MSKIVDYVSEDNKNDMLNDVRDSDYDAFVKLSQVFELNVFCPVHMEGEKDLVVAYLMNDAVESFLVFKDSVMTGKYIDVDEEQIPSVQMLKDGYMLIVNQGNKNIFTIKFSRLELRTYLFNYGSMGHFWIKGYEYLRQLSHQPLEDLEAGARINIGERKENPMDFALWKGAKPGEPSWETPWGNGRPGWHIECSSMARRYLGETIDIHCGGQDLIFPHHENEIAQSECCNGVPFAHYWMHNGYINVDNKKMSKSLGNFFTVRDVAEKYGYEPIRYLMVSSHYRMPINYSVEIIEQCKASLERLYNCKNNLEFAIENATVAENDGDNALIEAYDKHRQKFISAMDDDLNTADAITVMFELAKDINTNITNTPSKKLAEESLKIFMELANVLGLLYVDKKTSLDDEIEALIAQRNEARKNKDWATADKIRDELKARHIVLEDTPQGVKWKIVND